MSEADDRVKKCAEVITSAPDEACGDDFERWLSENLSQFTVAEVRQALAFLENFEGAINA